MLISVTAVTFLTGAYKRYFIMYSCLLLRTFFVMYTIDRITRNIIGHQRILEHRTCPILETLTCTGLNNVTPRPNVDTSALFSGGSDLKSRTG